MAGRAGADRAGLTPAQPGPADDRSATAHYDDPAYYDRAYADRSADVAYYVALARSRGGPILEYGVGTGRVALPLARAGFDVLGVDRSRPMLARLGERLALEPREVRARVRVRAADFRALSLSRKFPLVIAPFNALLHLHELDDFERFFARVRRHLAPGGWFVFDVTVPHPRFLGADPTERHGHPPFRHPTRGVVRYAERFDYDPIRQLLSMRFEFTPKDGSTPFVVPLSHRQLFPREIEALLRYNGFGEVHASADFTGAPPDDATETLVYACRVRAARGTGARPKAGARPARR